MDRRILKTRDSIKTAYMDLIITKKNHKITIAELSREANIDRKTFYLHYNSLDDVMTTIIQEHLLEFEQYINKDHLLQNTIDANIIMHAMNLCVMKHIDFYQAVVNHLGFEPIAKQMKEILAQKALETHSDSSTLSERDVKIYCNFLLSGIIAVYTDWFQNNSSITLEELEKLTSNVLHNGIQVLT